MTNRDETILPDDHGSGTETRDSDRSPAGEATRPLAADRHEGPSARIGELEGLAAPAADGEYLAHFRIHEMVGRGAMGTVYRAVDTLLDREVAVKVLSERFDRNSDFQDRFIAEAKILARMNHPHIPQIHFVGRANGRFFFAMEWIEGATLAQLADRGPLGEIEVLGIAVQVTEALEAAHREGIVHRDIKPSNLMVTPAKVVKVLDFGLAQSTAVGSIDGFEGTPIYASPEQVDGTRIDVRSDVYSLGLTLHHLLTRRPPRTEAEAAAALAGHLAPMSPRLPDDVECSPATRAILARMLAPAPADRYPTSGDLLAALRAAYPEPPIPAPAMRRAVALLGDLLLAGAPVVLAFFTYWKVKGFFLTTVLYDSVPGRVGLGFGLALWLTAWYLVPVWRRGQTAGQFLQGIRVALADGKRPPPRHAALRAAMIWGPACLAAGLQADWPPVPIGMPNGAAAANLCWLWSPLWVLAACAPVFGPGQRSLVDRLSGTRIIRAAWRDPLGAGDRHARPERWLAAARTVATTGILATWAVALLLTGLELRSALHPDRWRVFAKHTVFERVAPDDPGWDRLAARFLAGFLTADQSTPDSSTLTFERHVLFPTVYARPRPELIVDDAVLGTRSRHYGNALLGISGAKYYDDGGTRDREALAPGDPGQALRWRIARRARYHGSLVHFLRAVAHRRLSAEGFEVLNPEAFVGLFRSGDSFLLVAWPELRARVPGTTRPQVLRLHRGFLHLNLEGTLLSGSWGGSWRGGGLPNTVLERLAAEQDSIWGVTTEDVDRVLALE